MSLLFASAVWFLIAAGSVLFVWGIARMIEPSCYDKPESKNSLWHTKRCYTCLHAELSINYPTLACNVHGKTVEPDHGCEEWA